MGAVQAQLSCFLPCLALPNYQALTHFKFLDFIELCGRTTDGWSEKTFRVDHLRESINKKLLKFKLKTKGHFKFPENSW